MNEAEVSDRLGQLIEGLREINQNDYREIIQQLEKWRHDVETGDFHILAHIDFGSILDPTAIEEQVILQKQPTSWFGFMEWVRNIFVLAPITLTWYELSHASQDYQILAERDPSLLQLPFLLLWEKSFEGGASGFFTFSELAFVDSSILIAVIGLTVIVHWQKDITQQKSLKEASKLRLKAQKTLWGLEQLVAAHRSTEHFPQAVGHLATATQQFLPGAQTMLNTVQDQLTHLQTLADQRQAEFVQLDQFNTSLGTALGNMGNQLQLSINELNAKTTAFQVGIQSMTEAATRMTDSATLLYNSINDIKDASIDFKYSADKIDGVVGNLNTAATSMLNPLNRVATEIVKASQELKTALSRQTRGSLDLSFELLRKLFLTLFLAFFLSFTLCGTITWFVWQWS